MERNKYIEKMADNLPVLRAKLSLSQEQLGQTIGMSRGAIVSIEKKKRSMTWPTYLALVLVFSKNKDTAKLMEAFEIYNEELLGGTADGNY